MTTKEVKAKLSGLKSSFKTSNFSRPQLIIFVLAFGLIGYFLFRAFAAAPLVATLEAEQMSLPAGGSVLNDAAASAGKAIKFSANGTSSGSVNFPSSVTSLNVIARGDQCAGSPAMAVSLDGNVLLSNTSLGTTYWSTYAITPANAIAAGTHSLSISFTNAYSATKSPGKSGKIQTVCTRALYADVTNFYGPTPLPTAAPTVTLSASPISVTAGQAAMLTWNSTNADSCTASGAWSGSQPTTGSISTGALNQDSIYNLTCSGAGGSAVASTTVTVTAVTSNVNLALNKPATASSIEYSAFPAQYAFDGDGSTRWSSAYSDPQWLQVDLGSTQAIQRVVLQWEVAYASAFQIQTSNDGASWTTIYSTSSGIGGTNDLTISGSGRYVRMYGTQRGTVYGYSLWEMAVYGSSSGSGGGGGTTTTGPGIGNYVLGGQIYSQSHLGSYGILVADNDSGEAALICGLPSPTKPLIYFAGADVNKDYNTGVDWTTAYNNGWLLTDSSGNLLVNQGFTNNNVPDVGSSAYQQAWISNVVKTVKGYGCKGAFIDDVLKDIKPLSGVYPAKYPNQPAWEAAMVSFVKAVGTGLKNNGLYVAANATGYTPGDGLSDNGTLTLQFWQEIGPYLNGIMNEYYDQTSDGNNTLRSNGTAWYQNWDGWQRLIGTAQAMGDDFLGITYGSNTDTHTMRYGKASFLLEWNGGTSAFMYNSGTGDYWNSVWTADMGQPTGAKTQVASGIWMRQYAKGAVYVNTNTYAVAAGGHSIGATDAYIGP